jgi:hypothetical protein
MSTPQSKTHRLALDRLGKRSLDLVDTPIWVYDLRDEVPAAWATLEQDVDVEEPKVKITLRLDESVAKYYRAMGKGYQERINRVLATYAQMKIARVMELDREIATFRGALDAGLTVEQALKREDKA